MGIISDITAIAEIAEAADRIWAKLNTSRTCLIEFWNHTDYTLRVSGHAHAHGGFAEPPSIEVPPGSTDTFGSQSLSGSFFTGTEGFVSFAIADLDTTVVARWNNPFVGGNDCGGGVEGEKALAFALTKICGSGNDALMKFELRLVHDPALVIGGYRWSRLEGYAFDPAHQWFDNSAGPDGPSRSLFPHEAVILESWWSPVRGDNFATTKTQYTTPRMVDIEPGYRWYRTEGYVVSPHIDQPEGTVPLHRWYSPQRGDNWSTTDPRYTDPVRGFVAPDYRASGLEGYLFSPHLPQPRHTVPVHSWYSPERGDNFLTTDPRYRPRP